MTAKRKKGRPIGDTLGGIIVGFDQQIFRTMPPVQELVAKGQPVRGVSGDDGSEFEVVFPDDDGPPAGPHGSAPPGRRPRPEQTEPPAAKPDAAP